MTGNYLWTDEYSKQQPHPAKHPIFLPQLPETTSPKLVVNPPHGTKKGTYLVPAITLHLPTSASVCNTRSMPSTREWEVDKTLQSPVGRGKEGGDIIFS